MDDTSAELVRGIVNKQSEMGKELVGRRMIEVGQPPLRLTVLDRRAEGGTSSDTDIVLYDMPEAGVKPVGRVMPRCQDESRPQTPDSMPELELVGESGDDSDPESASDSEGQDRLESDAEEEVTMEGLRLEEDSPDTSWTIRPTEPDWL